MSGPRNPEGTGPRVRKVSMAPTIHGDEVARNTSPYTNEHRGQTQITDPGYTWCLHLAGSPDDWRHLARVIADAADDLERQLHDQALAHYGPMAEAVSA